MRRAIAAAVLMMTAPAACFSPSYERCAVECAAGDCPPDTFCLADGRCHAQPDEPLCTLGEIIDAGAGDAGGGDAAAPDAATFDAGQPVTPTTHGQLVISEIFKDPTQLDEEPREWFEIHNPTDLRFELMGLTVQDDDRVETFDVESSVVLPPHGRVVFARNGDPELNGGIDEDYDYADDFSLGNGSDVVEIQYPLGDVVLDRVEYGNALGGWPDEEGMSVSLDPDEHDATSNDDGAVWCDAAPTPGAPNPEC